MQAPEPSALNVPPRQVLQNEASASLQVPATQDAHDDEPAALAYLPASHTLQDAWPVAPCDDPAGQCSHTVFPSARAKVPDEHAVHVADFEEAATKPGRQFEQEAWPEELCVPTGHEVQFDERPGENVPALQGVH